MLSLFFPAQATIVISLGEHCSAAAAARTYGIRQAAYPFDWVISRFDSLCRVLEDDFAHFFEEKSLRLRHDKHGVIDYYGFEFVHDLPTITVQTYNGEDPIEENILRSDWREFVPAVREKYRRRIDRFRKAATGSEKVYFIRHYGIHKNAATRLRDIIRKRYPRLDFTILVVGSSPDFQCDWGLDCIRNFYLNDSVVWNDPNQWKRILSSLGLYPPPAMKYHALSEEVVCNGLVHQHGVLQRTRRKKR